MKFECSNKIKELELIIEAKNEELVGLKKELAKQCEKEFLTQHSIVLGKTIVGYPGEWEIYVISSFEHLSSKCGLLYGRLVKKNGELQKKQRILWDGWEIL